MGVRQRIVYCACGLAIVLACGAYYRWLWDDYPAFSQDIEQQCRARYCDFTYFYYPQAQQIREQDSPVKKYYYSPTFALLLVPLGMLAIDDAIAAWTWVQALSLLLLMLAGLLALRGLPRWTHALLLLLTLTSYPILNNLKWGQANITFMALIVLALALVERGFAKSAGLALSLVVASRYYPAIYALAFVARGRRAALVSAAVCVTVLLIVLPVWAMGAEHAWNFYARSAASIERAYATMNNNPTSQYLPSTLLRLTHAPSGSRDSLKIVAWILAACNATAALWAGYKCDEHRALWAFCFIALSTPLLVYTSWMHYFVYLPLAQTFLAAQLVTLRSSLTVRLAASMLSWLPSAGLSSIFFFEYAHTREYYAQHGYLLWSNLALLALAYLLLLMRLASFRCERFALQTSQD
jgi:hypothetical protein